MSLARRWVQFHQLAVFHIGQVLRVRRPSQSRGRMPDQRIMREDRLHRQGLHRRLAGQGKG